MSAACTSLLHSMIFATPERQFLMPHMNPPDGHPSLVGHAPSEGRPLFHVRESLAERKFGSDMRRQGSGTVVGTRGSWPACP